MQDHEGNEKTSPDAPERRKRIDPERALETIRAVQSGAYAPFGSFSLVRAVTRQKRSEPS